MEIYIKLLGTILFVYTAIINIAPFKIKKRDIITMIVLSELSARIVININEFIIMIPIIMISIVFLYKNSKNLLISTIIPLFSVIIAVIIDSSVSYMFIFIFDMDIYMASTISKVYVEFIATGFVLIFVTTKGVRYIIKKRHSIFNIELKNKFSILITLSLLITLIIFYINIILGSKFGFTNEVLKVNGLLFFIYFILLGVVMLILFKSITKEMELKNKQSHFESLQKYTDNLENLYSDMRAFKHDYVNIISSMIGYIEDDDMEGLKKHFNENILPLSNEIGKNNSKIALLKNIKIPEIKGLLSSKLIRAQEIGIELFIDIVEPIENIDMDIIDISRSLGILLDNAIEAGEKCENPTVKIAFVKRGQALIIAILNKCPEDTPPIYKIYKKGYSTKGENRGVGLSNLKEILEKYNNVSIDTTIENEEFIQKITIDSNFV
ncbi:sensor histidine kinase [Clostridium sp. 'White wine YQ']|uniref:sensor histidine kinase n=1 Tax=Clostridium sp. 'White wine YQ' TaxID=3027474 RepID=UPI002365D5B3|nr:GHKL domain-containing protein [Clostridium sp. 'White wine YQ']MDD7795014.1 GHKL domain-containing protein [Clostridium sp. 'White wine YQ']